VTQFNAIVGDFGHNPQNIAAGVAEGLSDRLGVLSLKGLAIWRMKADRLLVKPQFIEYNSPRPS